MFGQSSTALVLGTLSNWLFGTTRLKPSRRVSLRHADPLEMPAVAGVARGARWQRPEEES